MPKRIGMVVRRLRKARKMSQNRLAKDARVSQSYISRLETGGRGIRPGIVVSQRLAKALGVPVMALLEWEVAQFLTHLAIGVAVGLLLVTMIASLAAGRAVFPGILPISVAFIVVGVAGALVCRERSTGQPLRPGGVTRSE